VNPNAAEPLTWDTDDNGTWTAYCGWNGLGLVFLAETAGSALVLDSATDGLLNTAVVGPSGDGWVDIGCDLLSFQFRRGASDDSGILTRYEAGQAEMVFDNTSLNFEPDAPAWDIDLGTTIVVLGRERDTIETIAQDPGENPWDWLFGVFKGTIDDWRTHGYESEQRVAEWSLVDDVARLQSVNGLEQSSQGAGDTTEERINRILANAEWSSQTGSFSGVERSTVVFPQAGVANPTHQATTLAQPAWEMILRAADAGQRSVFFSGTGRIVATPVVPTLALQWERWIWGCEEFGLMPLVAVDWEYSKRQLVNTVDAAKAGGSQITVQDETSANPNRHGVYRTGRNDLTLEDDADVQVWAGTIVQWSSEPTPRVTRMRVVPSVWTDDDLNVGYLQEHYQSVDLTGSHAVALVVGNSGSLSAGDLVVQARLEGQFDTVTVFDDSTAEGSISAGTFDAVVITDSVTPGTVGTKWKDFAGGVLLLAHDLWDDHELIDSSGATELSGGSAPSIMWVDTGTPSWLSLVTGAHNLQTDGGTVVTAVGGTGDLPGASDIVARVTDAVSSSVLCWTIDEGANRDDATPAPGRRVALSGTEQHISDLPSTAWLTLLGDAMGWLVPSVFGQELVSEPAVSNAWQALLEFSDWVGSSWVGEDTGLRHEVLVEMPGTDRILRDTVTFRGVQWTLDDSTVEIEFVTSSIRQFLDQFILDDNVQGILDAGHRVS
jgi:hypothetical protein